MKILYILSQLLEHGSGGHFYSCSTIAEKYHMMNSKGDIVDICNIGLYSSSVLSASKLRYYFIDVAKNGLFLSIIKLLNLVKKNDYDVIHAYDARAYAFMRIIYFLTFKPILLTKCGGPNPTYYPFSSNLILFSKENFDYFKNQTKFNLTKFFVIPNRETEKKINTIDISTYKKKLGVSNNIILLRIARIGHKYTESIIRLIKTFSEIFVTNRKVRLLLIGAVEEKECYEKLMMTLRELNHNLKEENAVILKINKEYTLNASRFIDIADFVVATGRGVIESMAKSKPTFIVLNSGCISLVSPGTSHELMYYNFSGRISEPPVTDFGKFHIQETLPKLIQNKKYLKNISLFSRDYYSKHLDIKNTISIYEDIYHSSMDGQYRIHPKDFISNIYSTYSNFKDARETKKNSYYSSLLMN